MDDGQQIGAYRIERTLGRGGFGVVYVGVDERLGRRAAIKQLLPALSSQREFVERFFREARAAASIDHPGIVEIYDVGWHTDGSAYFAMKLLDGDSLAQRLRARGMLTIAAATAIVRQVARAVAAAHARGIIHRDLKPDNIMLVRDPDIPGGERAVVLDFGIAKLTADGFSSSQSTDRTVTGVLLGTPLYMSPEQCRGARDIDHRSDIYALGCILFEMLAGRPPFPGTPGEVVGMHQFVGAPAIRSLRADVPPALDAVIACALAKEPAARFSSIEMFGDALAPFTSIDTPPPPPSEVKLVDAHAETMASTSEVRAAAPPDGKGTRSHLADTPDTASSRGDVEASADPDNVASRGRRRRAWLLVGAGALVLVAAGIGFAVMSRSTSTSTQPGDAHGDLALVEDASGGRVDITHLPHDGFTRIDTTVDLARDGGTRIDVTADRPHDGGTRIDVTADQPVDAGVRVDFPRDLAGLEARCREHQAREEWELLLECAGRLRVAGDPAQAEAHLKLVVLERNAKAAYDKMVATLDGGSLKLPSFKLLDIPAESIYRPRALEAYKRAEAKIVGAAIGEMRGLDCDAYAAEIEKRKAKQGVLFAVAVEARHACKAPPVAATERDCDTDLAEGRAALRRGALTDAKAIFEHAVHCYSNNEERRFYLIAAACRVKDEGTANRHIGKVPVFGEIVVERICRENGVTLRR